MAIKTYKPTSPARRFYTTASYDEITKKEPEKSLLVERRKLQVEIILVESPLDTLVVVTELNIDL